MSPNEFEEVAKGVLNDLREKKAIDEEFVNELNSFPQIDYLRAEVTETDIDILFDLTLSEKEPIRGFGISLLGGLKENQKVKSFFKKLWSETEDYTVRLRVMWRLLDDENLEIASHENIYKFVMDNWERFLTDTSNWHGGADFILKAMKYRLDDNTVPESRKWVYLCSAFGSNDKKSLKKILLRFINSKASIVSIVTKDILMKLE